MKLIKMKKIAITIFMIVILSCSMVEAKVIEHKEVTVASEVEIAGVNTVKARNKAIDTAMRKAVELVVSYYVSSETIVNNFQLINDMIYNKSEAYIESFKILSEDISDKEEGAGENIEEALLQNIEEQEKESVYSVNIKAYVSVKNVIKDLVAINILSEEKNLPRFVLFIPQKDTGGEDYRFWWSRAEEQYVKSTTAEEEIRKRFMEKGLYASDKGKLLKTLDEEKKELKSDIADSDAVKLIHQTDAKIIIVGRALTQVMGKIEGTEMRSILANVNAKVLDPSGNLIAYDSVSEKVLHTNNSIGADEAMKKAASVLADRLFESINEHWGEEEKVPMSVELNINGLTKGVYLDLLNMLKNDLRGVSNVMPKSFSSGGAINFSLNIMGDTVTFANKLNGRGSSTFNIVVTSYTPVSVQAILMEKKTEPVDTENDLPTDENLKEE